VLNPIARPLLLLLWSSSLIENPEPINNPTPDKAPSHNRSSMDPPEEHLRNLSLSSGTGPDTSRGDDKDEADQMKVRVCAAVVLTDVAGRLRL